MTVGGKTRNSECVYGWSVGALLLGLELGGGLCRVSVRGPGAELRRLEGR